MTAAVVLAALAAPGTASAQEPCPVPLTTCAEHVVDAAFEARDEAVETVFDVVGNPPHCSVWECVRGQLCEHVWGWQTCTAP